MTSPRAPQNPLAHCRSRAAPRDTPAPSPRPYGVRSTSVTVVRSVALFLLAAILEIGGAWMVWQGVREHRGTAWTLVGIVSLGAYGFVATLQPSGDFGRVLAAYGGVFIAGSLAWGAIASGYRPDRYDIIGAAVCLVGVGVIMYAPRGR